MVYIDKTKPNQMTNEYPDIGMVLLDLEPCSGWKVVEIGRIVRYLCKGVENFIDELFGESPPGIPSFWLRAWGQRQEWS